MMIEGGEPNMFLAAALQPSDKVILCVIGVGILVGFVLWIADKIDKRQ